MKAYLDVHDVMNVTGNSKNKCYEILHFLRKDTDWENTYEGKFINGIVIPTNIFIEYFPNAKKSIHDL